MSTAAIPSIQEVEPKPSLEAPVLIHLPLERYTDRYTHYLMDWEILAFTESGRFSTVYTILPPDRSSQQATTTVQAGAVLDRTRRSMFALDQVANAIELMEQLHNSGQRRFVIYCSDFFTPGIEAIAYWASAKRTISISMNAFCWAQTFDRFDFTATIPQLQYWMRKWEDTAVRLYHNIFVASTELADRIETVYQNEMMTAAVHTVGLPYNWLAISQAYPEINPQNPMENRVIDCIYTSRFDQEKTPEIFISLVESLPDLAFAVCSGKSEELALAGLDPELKARFYRCRERNLMTVFGASKKSYLSMLSDSKVQFNCARQDWVSYTLLDALTFGCTPLYPNVRSFPEALDHYTDCLYPPNDVTAAAARLQWILSQRMWLDQKVRHRILDRHGKALSKITKEMADGSN